MTDETKDTEVKDLIEVIPEPDVNIVNEILHPETEEIPVAEKKVRDIVEFCLECSWTNDRPKGLVSCPACGGKVIRQKRELISKARADNRNKRGV